MCLIQQHQSVTQGGILITQDKIMPPVMVGEPPNGHLKIGFVATSAIKVGEDLFYNYGIKDPELPWLNTDAKKISTTLQALTSPQPQVQSAPSSKTSKPRPRLVLSPDPQTRVW